MRISTLEQASDIINNAIVLPVPVVTGAEKGMRTSVVHDMLAVEASSYAPHLRQKEVPRDRNS